MTFLKLCLFLFVFTITVESKEKTFKNVTLLTNESKTIVTIIEDDTLKKYIPDYPIERVVVTGRIPILNEDAFAGITNVKHFYFYKNEIDDIRPGAFRNLNVESLEIAYTNINIIRKGVFNDLMARTLVVSKNPKLESIADEALDNPNIETLILDENSLKNFSKDVFRNLPNLKFLLLKNNKIEHIDTEVFNGLKIQVLDLSGNIISTIPSDVILNLKSLVRIFFGSNRLTSIPSGIFNTHQTLQEVGLDLNQISSVASDAFDNMPQLRNVSLAFNNLTRIDSDWFKNCPNINYVNFGRNCIKELPDEAFKNFCNNHFLTFMMFENKIRRISPTAFKGLKKINALKLMQNNIEKWDDKFLEDADSVHTLDLFDNKIVCPEGDFNNIFKAEFTHLGNNPLEKQCLEKIEKWQNQIKNHFVCTKWSCSIDN